MGLVKAMMQEAEDRGWDAPETHVCADCVEDEYLKSLIQDHAEADTCDYCGCHAAEPIAAPTKVVMEAVAGTVYYYFDDPTSAGVPWDEGASIIEPMYTAEVLMDIGLDCHDGLFSDIEAAFQNWGWVSAAEGHWASSHPHQRMSYSWSSFVYAVKHRTRYFFTSMERGEPGEYSPHELLQKIGKLVQDLSLVSTLPAEMRFYRVRARGESDTWEICARELGPPPEEKARAGRMNPAGISYLYLAYELETAIAEVLSGPPCKAAFAEFQVTRNLTVIDLCQVPPLPSIFDNEHRDIREGLLFIAHFIESISRPVRKDGNEHVDYVPSQVVSEFFAKAFRDAPQGEIHGMVYPSAIQPGGRNLVLFPPNEPFVSFDSVVEYQMGGELAYGTWRQFSDAIKPRE